MKKLTKILFYVPKKILIKVIFFLFLLLCFNIYVNAETINNTCSSINQACSTNGRFTYSLYQSAYDTYSTGTFKTTYNGKADYMVFDFDYDLLGNATYQLSVSAVSTDFRNINKSNVWIESSSDCATPTGYLDITNVSFSKSKLVITFKTVSNTSRFILTIGDPEGPAITGVSTFGISSIDITTLESNDTQNIIDNNNQNTNSIIDNANDNTDKIIGSINDNFNSCRPSNNLFPGWVIGKGLNANNGALTTWADGAVSTDYISVDFSKNSSYYLSGLSSNLRTFVASYDSNDVFLGRTDVYIQNGFSFSESSFSYGIPQGSGKISKIRITSYVLSDGSTPITEINNIQTMLNTGSYALNYEEHGKEICQNKLDDTNDKLDNLNETLTDSSSPNTESFLDDVKSVFDDGPISTLILMPFTLLNRYVDGFNGSCSSISLGNLYGTDLSLPCIDLENKLGSTLWTTIDGLVSIFMIYNIGMLFVMVFNDITSLRDTFDSLYTPQHAKPLGKHTSEVE